MEEPNAKTIDFAKVFAGVSYPEDSVTVILNEELGYLAHVLQKKMSDAAIKSDSEARKSAEAEYERVVESAADWTYTFHLTGVSRELREGVARAVREEFPTETDMFGVPKPSVEADEAYKARRYALHTKQIEGPGGAVAVAPTPENLAEFLKAAPDRAIQLIDAKIVELSGEGAAVGFDSIIRSADFLSKPSPKG